MYLSKLVECLSGWEIDGEIEKWDREITSLSIDTKKCGEGSLFICLRGGNVDSHTLVREAEKTGAVAIVAQEPITTTLPVIHVEDTRKAVGLLASVFYGEPCKRLKIIGITGTNGKTTSSYMLASILKNAGKNVGVIGTLGIVYNDKNLPSPLTTPDPIDLHACLAEMLLAGVEYVVMEVSAHALYYKKTEGIRFTACIFTNFTQDHLDFFNGMEEYKKAKMRLFAPESCSVAILNGDDEVGREIAAMREKEGGRVVFYGLNTPADCFAIITDECIKGTECVFNLNDNLYRVRLRMLGEYNVYNALATAACAQILQCENAIPLGLYQVKNVQGRLQKVEGIGENSVYVDFAHTPDGLEKSLQTLKRYCAGRLVCLFGCGGNRDKDKREKMGKIAAKLCDFAILTSDNPRYEDPLDIIDQIERGYRAISNRYVVVPDREKALDYALDCLSKEDILLVAGKGGEDYQEIMGIKYPFNDQDMVIKLMCKKGKI